MSPSRFFLILKLLLPKFLLSPYFFMSKSTFLMSHKDSSSKGFKLILSDHRISFNHLIGLSLSKYNCISYILFVFLCNLVGNTCKHLLQKPNPRTQSDPWSYHFPKTNSHHLSSPDPHPMTVAFFSKATKTASVLCLYNRLVTPEWYTFKHHISDQGFPLINPRSYNNISQSELCVPPSTKMTKITNRFEGTTKGFGIAFKMPARWLLFTFASLCNPD